ncbi:HAD family hydrolase [Tsukamurella sp. 8F]|uniref:HAD family hydrolase n=1 Tax=unclassified Tsukamurella TaxID=2633480 RepID=UPI0023B9F658|nr:MULTISPECIES: HAD family hydrolase [unclassified Tsukamurella]MDF0531760.1 HAD family hydrolase [Tsukamurella sp. 8J]MDF0588038.1 HAD family hydrolase [Tsukamurella sp. 8F]
MADLHPGERSDGEPKDLGERSDGEPKDLGERSDGEPKAVLFDFSGTLFRLEEDESWFAGYTDADGAPIEGESQAELMRRMTAPMGLPVPMDPDMEADWHQRDLDPVKHRRVYHHVLASSGIADPDQRTRLYGRIANPDCWTVYPDTADALRLLHGKGIRIGVLSNIAYDIRPAFVREGIDGLVDAYLLSFEVGAMKPSEDIFAAGVAALGAPAEQTLMVGDSEEADGGCRALGMPFVLVDPVPTAQRPDGLLTALRHAGITAGL